MPTTPEGRVKAAIKAYLKSVGAWYFCPVSNGMGVHGIPDFVVCYRGQFIGIEAKAPGKLRSVSELQKMQGSAITAAGGRWLAADSVHQVIEYFAGLSPDEGASNGSA